MPELPEVETIRRELEPHLVGRKIVHARLLRRDVLVVPGDPPGGFARARTNTPPRRVRRRDLLEGARVLALERHGKQLAIVADQGVICVHLGMSGQLRLDDGDPRDHVHALWRFDHNRTLRYRDPRRFGGLWAMPDLDALRASRWARLGPDALSIRAEQLARAVRDGRRSIKSVLLDQRAIAGVGNIYADEALFASRLRPDRPAHELSADEIASLVRQIRAVLRRAIKARGSSLRDHRTPAGQPGAFQHAHKVYARAGRPCPVCQSPLEGRTIAQRSTVFCPRCQR